MTDHDIAYWGLVAQWAGVVVALLSIAVAGLFGALTLKNSRGVRDAQQRASLTAAGSTGSGGFAAARGAGSTGQGAPARSPVSWEVTRDHGDSWFLRNGGVGAAYDVTIEGYTDLDKRRLTTATGAAEVPAGATIPFVLTSRFTTSGPANLTVGFSTETGGERSVQIVQVPAD